MIATGAKTTIFPKLGSGFLHDKSADPNADRRYLGPRITHPY